MRNLSISFLLLYSHLVAQSDAGRVTYRHREAYQHNQLYDTTSTLLFTMDKSVYNVGRRAEDSLLVAPFGGSTRPIKYFDRLYPYCYRDIKANQMYYFRHTYIGNTTLLVEDTLPVIRWSISNQTRMFGKYTGQLARGSYGRRTYEVWFCPDIPVSSGPYKLWGLPGIILEAVSTDGHVSFLFQSLELSPGFATQVIVPRLDTVIRGGMVACNAFIRERTEKKHQEIRAKFPDAIISDDPGYKPPEEID